LGYADGAEGRKESRGADANRNGEDDVEEYEDERTQQPHNSNRTFSNGSPKLPRAEPPSYFDEQIRLEKKGTGNSGQYRDTAVFSDEEPTPLGMQV
jgi:hypothetical protein